MLLHWKSDTEGCPSYVACECCCSAVNFSRVSQFRRGVELEIKLLVKIY